MVVSLLRLLNISAPLTWLLEGHKTRYLVCIELVDVALSWILYHVYHAVLVLCTMYANGGSFKYLGINTPGRQRISKSPNG